jgi:hypothetical protein
MTMHSCFGVHDWSACLEQMRNKETDAGDTALPK